MVAPRLFRVNIKVTERVALLAWVLLASSLSALAVPADDVPGCGRFGDNWAGKAFDYRSATPEELDRVEKYHFVDEHAAIMSGRVNVSSASFQGSAAGGLDYTLRTWPNHPYALADMIRIAKMTRSERPGNIKYTVECYLRRAVAFAKEDPVPQFLFGLYELDRGKEVSAIEHLEAARSLDENNANLLYNLGLAYYRLKDYQRADHFAHEAYNRGFPLPGLRDMLKRIGKWTESATSIDPQLQGESK